MKRILYAFALILALACVLISCNSSDLPEETTATKPEETTTTTSEETTTTTPEETTSEAPEEKFPTSQGLAYEVNSDGKTCTVIGIGTCVESNVYVGGYIDGYKVIAIGDEAFRECNLKSITIGDSVTSIGKWAFLLSSNLTKVTIPDSVTTIGDEAFRFCSALTRIVVDGDNAAYKSISGNLYSKDGTVLLTYAIGKQSESFVIPDSVTTIGASAFASCFSLTSVIIGDSVTTIGSSAFYNCVRLERVTIPNSVTIIDSCAFAWCDNLTSVKIPDLVTTIGDEAFLSCSKLTSITIPDSVTNIGNRAFEGCSKLTSVTIGTAVTSIGNDAFWSCSNLDSVYIYDIIKWCDISFSNYRANPLSNVVDLYLVKNDSPELIVDFVIPDSVDVIKDYAFAGCKNLTSVMIPNSVTTIGNGAFHNCNNLTSITIADSVTTIGDEAFCFCNRLTSITIPSSVTAIGQNAFGFCFDLASVNFITPNGWWYASEADATSGTAISAADLSVPTTATRYLKGTYSDYYWYRTE